MNSNYKDVLAFNQKFGLPIPLTPQELAPGVFSYRLGFLKEELAEFEDAETLAKQADALIDLVYVAMGTAILMGLPWEKLWNEVQRANMSKVRAKDQEESLQKTGRGHAYDVVKPENWTPPDIARILKEHTSE